MDSTHRSPISKKVPRGRPDSRRGFTRLELLALSATLALLVLMVAPALARPKTNSHRFQCLNNLREIESAMVMYAHDYYDWFPPNPDDPGDTTPGHHWVSNVTLPYNPDLFQNPTYSLITPYLNGNINVLRCPADPRQGLYSGSQTNLIGKTIPATRSVSMSGAVGSVCDPFWSCSGGHNGPPRHPVNGPWLDGAHSNGCSGADKWATFGKTTSFRAVSPATIFIVADENPFSINDAVLATCADPSNVRFVDYPACYHNGAGGVSFCDGHAELHKWRGNAIKVIGGAFGQPSTALDLLDFNWLAQHSSVRAN
jgi:prepilin-type processing-associated H-X9-DG protein